jgi:phosphonate transport system substrate-binding protein
VSIRFRKLLVVAIATAIMLLSGCKGSGSSDTSKPMLRLSMIPTNDPGKMVRDSQPLISYLEKETGAKVQMTIPTNYAAVVEAIGNDQVDVAYLGGFTYVQASKRFGVIPLIQRDQDQNFHSLFITNPDSGIKSLTDLKGHSFAFGDVNSTSGHLMPEYFMREAKIDSDVITRATYTGGHDTTALAVANKKVDAGALDETIYQKMVKDGKLESAKAVVFYTTPPFFDYVWAARKGIDAKIAETFSAAFLKLDTSNPEQKPILEFLRATRYVRAEDSDYDKLRQAAKDAGLMR